MLLETLRAENDRQKKRAAVSGLVRNLSPVIGLIVIGVGFYVVCGPKGDETASMSRATPAPANVPPAPAPSAPSRRDALKVSSLVLPSKRIDVHAILGQSQRGVDKQLGRPTKLDDGLLYEEVEGSTAVVVQFEGSKAIKVSVSPPDFVQGEAHNRQVLEWLGASWDDDEWEAWAGGLVVWDPAAKRRHARRAAASALEKELRGRGGEVKVTTKGREEDTLRILWAGCNEVALDAIVDGASFQMVAARDGFIGVECANDGRVWRAKVD